MLHFLQSEKSAETIRRRFRRGGTAGTGEIRNQFRNSKKLQGEIGMDTIKFGKFIRDMRKERGLTQKQLADLLYVSDKAVSKWENGACFPDIKMLDSLAEHLGVSILELMQSERVQEPVIDREEAELVVRDTIIRSEEAEEQKRQLGKARLLLLASACGLLYLLWAGIRSLLLHGRGVPLPDAAAALGGGWYKDPVVFYLWAGFLSAACGIAAFWLLWKNERIREVKIGRHKIKSTLTILMDILVVLLLHTYLSNIANNERQLLTLPEAIPVNAYITTPDGNQQAGIFIPDRIVQGVLDSEYVENLHLNVRLKAGLDRVIPGQWENLNLYLAGANCLEAAVRDLEETDVVWNAGEDSSLLQGTAAKCIVSKELMEENGWKLGDQITLCQYYYYRQNEKSTELFANPLETTVYEIAGYVDLGASISVGGNVNVTPDILIPFHLIREAYRRQEIPFYADAVSFRLSDTLNLNAFKQEMKALGLQNRNPLTEDHSLNGTALTVNDAAFIDTANHLRQVIDAVRAFFPFLLTLIVGAGYLVTLLLLNSRKKEAALLRSIGLGRWRCFRIFFTEQLLLVVSGVVLGNVLSVLLQGNYGADSALSGCLVGICYMLGNSLAIWKILKVSVMEALFET